MKNSTIYWDNPRMFNKVGSNVLSFLNIKYIHNKLFSDHIPDVDKDLL